MEVGVALPVPVADHVHRDAIDVDGHLGAVIAIESAQEDLLRLPAARVLRDDEPRHQLEHVLGRLARAQLQVELAHAARGSRRLRPLRGDDHLGERDRRRSQVEVDLDRFRVLLDDRFPFRGLESDRASPQRVLARFEPADREVAVRVRDGSALRSDDFHSNERCGLVRFGVLGRTAKDVREGRARRERAGEREDGGDRGESHEANVLLRRRAARRNRRAGRIF